MRVIAGKFKGRRLKMPKGIKVRVTKDRIKESLFQILDKKIEGKDILDLFAGSGSLGIEALSRGAKSVTFVETNPKCIKAIRETLTQLDIKGSNLLRMDAFDSIRYFAGNNIKFDIILLDPPYYKKLGKKVLNKLERYDILKNLAFVVIEHSKGDLLPSETANMTIIGNYKYSDIVISIYKRGK